MRSECEVKTLEKDHLVRVYIGCLGEMAVEESERGPVIIVGGSRILIPKGERKK